MADDSDGGSWICDGTLSPNGCYRRGAPESLAEEERYRYHCQECENYDECESCVALHLVENFSLIEQLHQQCSDKMTRQESRRNFHATSPVFHHAARRVSLPASPPPVALSSRARAYPDFLLNFPRSIVPQHGQPAQREFSQTARLKALKDAVEEFEAEYRYRRSLFVGNPSAQEISLPLLNSAVFCDITFLVGPEAVPRYAYRGFLAQISPLWCHSFTKTSGFRENSSDRSVAIRLPEISPAVFDSVLSWAYLRNPSKLHIEEPQDALKLLVFSAQYEIQPLLEYAQCYFFADLEQFPDLDMYELVFTLQQLGLDSGLRCCHWILCRLVSQITSADDIYSMWAFCTDFKFDLALASILDIVAYGLDPARLLALANLVHNATAEDDSFYLLRQAVLSTLAVNMEYFLPHCQVPTLLSIKYLLDASGWEIMAARNARFSQAQSDSTLSSSASSTCSTTHELLSHLVDQQILSLLSPASLDSFERQVLDRQYPLEWLKMVDDWTRYQSQQVGISLSQRPSQIVSWLQSFAEDSRYRETAILALTLPVDIQNLMGVLPLVKLIGHQRFDLVASLLSVIVMHLHLHLMETEERRPSIKEAIIELWFFWCEFVKPLLVAFPEQIEVPAGFEVVFAQYFARHFYSLLDHDELLRTFDQDFINTIIESPKLSLDFEIQVVQLLLRWSSLLLPGEKQAIDWQRFHIRTFLLSPTQMEELQAVLPPFTFSALFRDLGESSSMPSSSNVATSSSSSSSSSFLKCSRTVDKIEWHTLTCAFQEKERYSEFFVSSDRLELSMTSDGRSWAHSLTHMAHNVAHGSYFWLLKIESLNQSPRSGGAFDGIVVGVGAHSGDATLGVTNQLGLWPDSDAPAHAITPFKGTPRPWHVGDEIGVVLNQDEGSVWYFVNDEFGFAVPGIPPEIAGNGTLMVAIRGNGRVRLISGNALWTGCQIRPHHIPLRIQTADKPAPVEALIKPKKKPVVGLFATVRSLMQRIRPSPAPGENSNDLIVADALDQFVWVEDDEE